MLLFAVIWHEHERLSVTLKTAMLRNGDQGKRITYLKLDIEQNEVDVLREAIDSKFLAYTYLPIPTRLLQF